MRTAEDILSLYRDRKAKYATLHSKMQGIADIYNNRADVPLADMDRVEQPSIPNLLQQGVDQMAGRITSVTPMVAFSSARPGTRKYDRRAHDASRVVTGWWQGDRTMMKMKQRGRRLVAYSMAPVVVRWDFRKHCPIWQVRHPLETLPSLDLQPGQVKPQDVIFSFDRSYGWLVENGYESQVRALISGRDKPSPDSLVTLVEYMDSDVTVLLATGYYPAAGGYGVSGNTLRGVVLESYENLGGVMPAVIPTRLTLDQMTGQFDGMVGMYYQQAKLMALESIAVEKGIFPDTYLVSRTGEQARFLDGPHDGRTGRVNIVAGGDVKEMQTSPGYLTNPTIDRIERAQRVTSGIPSEFGGESGSNIRTGRRGDAVLAATIDFPIAEAQEIFAYSLEEENRVAIALSKRIDGDERRTIYVGTSNTRRPVTYVPNETFEVEEHVVSYPAAGTDVNSLVIGLGQRVGLGIMSKETAAELDPYIDSPEQEHDRIIAEGLEQALMSGIQQQAAQGALPPLVVSKVMTLVRNDRLELAEALTRVTEEAAAEEAAKQQAAMQQQPPGAQTAEQAMSAAALQGLAGGVQPPAETMPGMKSLGDLLGTLRRPVMTVTPMRGAARGAM